MSKRFYMCPACGNTSTVVFRTSSYQCCIVRERKCMICGHKHRTTEMPVDVTPTWQDVARNLIERIKARLKHEQTVKVEA